MLRVSDIINLLKLEAAIGGPMRDPHPHDRPRPRYRKETMSQQKIRLAHIYIEQADVARQQSDLVGAVNGFTKAIDIYKEMAQEEPACWNLVADTIERVAATYKAAGGDANLTKAAECLKEAATLREHLAKNEAATEDDSDD